MNASPIDSCELLLLAREVLLRPPAELAFRFGAAFLRPFAAPADLVVDFLAITGSPGPYNRVA
jgi:hypothetical protein